MDALHWLPLGEGFILGAGLIIAIGAQNAFVIRQGVKGAYVFPVATACFLTDALLITAGAAGVGTLIAKSPWLAGIAAWGGAAFLIVYGAMAFRDFLRPKAFDWQAGANVGSVNAAVGAALAFSWLNPHVYLDTVVMLGGIAAQYDQQPRLWFTGGAVLASCVWFYGIAYGAQGLAPFFRSRTGARTLDGVVCVVMWLVAATLIMGALEK